MAAPDYAYQSYIRCSPGEAWNAIIDGDRTVDYFYGTRVESEWIPGAPIRYSSPDGAVVADGEVLAIDDGTRIERTFHPRWDPELDAAGPVREIWTVEDADGLTRLTVACHDLDPAGPTYPHFVEGIPLIVSGMKTLLETGEPLAR